MRVYGLKMSRPDKDRPFIGWFNHSQTVNRQVPILLNLTIEDYGHNQRVLHLGGYKRALQAARLITGEDRIEVVVISTAAQPWMKVYARAFYPTRWQRATPEDIEQFNVAPRIPSHVKGVEDYLRRQRERQSGAWKIR